MGALSKEFARIGSIAVGAAIFISAASGLRAQEKPGAEPIRLVDPTAFTEKFSGNTKVSGQLLSGLTYRSLPTELDPSEIYLAGASGRICVRLTTEDGRYWASNLFEHVGPLLQTQRLAFPTAYETQLKSYLSSEMMVLAARADDCADFEGHALIPGIVGTAEESAKLLAYVNVSQGRTQARLEKDGILLTEQVRCEAPSDGARVTYSAVCNLELPADLAAGEYDLIISVRSLTGGGLSESYRVFLD